MTVTDKDRDILARTLWGEFRGEGPAGHQRVTESRDTNAALSGFFVPEIS